MKETTYTTTTKDHLVVVGYEDETHIEVNTISFAVILVSGEGKELSRQLEYNNLEEAMSAGQTMLNFRFAMWRDR